MDPFTALLSVAALLALAGAVGVAWRLRQGRARRAPGREVVEPARLGAVSLGEQATLLQFSTEMCSRCPGVHRTLAGIASTRDGVSHLDVDLTHRPDIARHFNVLQTPTTLLLDREGAIHTRFGGVPNRHVLELELARLTGQPLSGEPTHA
ncbi:thioredoxin family protein [Microbacterium sediminicola]|uniref:TlpA family protein disulfide reductase n=1 Tax=Microbacterium sediminicola TaxID=415210 RepID=UPI0031CDC35E